MTDFEAAGGCLCGAVRFRLTAKPTLAGYCHCRMCQKAGRMAVATVSMEDFAFTQGEPLSYESTPGWLRLFCGICGSSLGLHTAAEAPKLMDVTVACLDDPNVIEPKFHQYTASQATWFEMADDLPRYAEVAPEIEDLWSRLEGWQQPDTKER